MCKTQVLTDESPHDRGRPNVSEFVCLGGWLEGDIRRRSIAPALLILRPSFLPYTHTQDLTNARHRHHSPPSHIRIQGCTALSALDTRRQVGISQSDVKTRRCRSTCNVSGDHILMQHAAPGPDRNYRSSGSLHQCICQPCQQTLYTWGAIKSMHAATRRHAAWSMQTCGGPEPRCSPIDLQG